MKGSMGRLIKEFDNKTSLLVGICSGSILLMIFRFMGMPISGLIISFLFSGFLAALIYPRDNGEFKGKGGLGAMTGVFLGLLLSLVFIVYVIYQQNFIFTTSLDISLAIYSLIIITITFVCGYVMGFIGGSLGSLFRYSWKALSKK